MDVNRREGTKKSERDPGSQRLPGGGRAHGQRRKRGLNQRSAMREDDEYTFRQVEWTLRNCVKNLFLKEASSKMHLPSSLWHLPLARPTQFPEVCFQMNHFLAGKKLFYRPSRCTCFIEHFPQFLKVTVLCRLGGWGRRTWRLVPRGDAGPAPRPRRHPLAYHLL